MSSLYLLIPIAIVLAALVTWLLVWAVNNGQYDDLDKDSWRALNDDLEAPPASSSSPSPSPSAQKESKLESKLDD